MTGQREGLVGDIFNKVKDLLTDEEPKDPKKAEDPPLETQCCGKPPGIPLLGGHVISEGEIQHEPDCPKHPDNIAREEVAS